MSAKIVKISDYQGKSETRSEVETRATTRAFIRRVDMNLINIHAFGYEYILRISQGVYKTIGAGGDVCTNVDYILRVEHQVKSCNLHECMQLLEMLDELIESPTIATSRELPFITHVRNKVFQQKEFLQRMGLRVYTD